MIYSPLHHIGKDAKQLFKPPLPPSPPIFYIPRSGSIQKAPLRMPWYFTGSPLLLSPPPGNAGIPLQVNFCLAAAQPGSLSQVGGRSLEPGGQPSCGGGRHRQPARQRSGNVLLVILIPCSRVSAVAPGGHGFPPCPRPPWHPPLPAHFIVVGHRRTVRKG